MSIFVGSINCLTHGAAAFSWKNGAGVELCSACSLAEPKEFCPNCNVVMGEVKGFRRLFLWGQRMECFHCSYHPITEWTSERKSPILDAMAKAGTWTAQGTANLIAGAVIALYAAVIIFLVLLYKCIDWAVGKEVARIYGSDANWYFWGPVVALAVVGVLYLITHKR